MNYLKKSILIWILMMGAIIEPRCQTGPGGVGMSDGSSALKLWLDASSNTYVDSIGFRKTATGDRVMLWKDLSGCKNDVFSMFDTSRPTFIQSNRSMNGQSAIRFARDSSGSNRRNFLASNFFTKTNDITIYCVFHPITKSEGNDTTPYKSQNYHRNMWYYGSGLVDGGADGFVNDISLAFCDTSIAAGSGDSTTSTDYCVKIPAGLKKTYFATLQKEAWSGNLSIAQNGGTPAEFLAGAQPINNSTRYFIGCNSNYITPTVVQFFDGYIANVIIFNKILTLAEKIILENYLSSKYAIPLVTNDLYRFDDESKGNFDEELVGIGKAIDGSFIQSAKGEGMLQVANNGNFQLGEFIFAGHNGKATQASQNGTSDIIQSQLERTWVVSTTATSNLLDFKIDPNRLPYDVDDDLVMIIDKNKNGLFSDERLGEGILPADNIVIDNQISFRNVKITNGDRFTFGKLKNVCKMDCDPVFSPNGDGIADNYYIDLNGKINIFNRQGQIVKTIQGPSFWDGSNDKGDLVSPGAYYLVKAENIEKIITLIR